MVARGPLPPPTALKLISVVAGMALVFTVVAAGSLRKTLRIERVYQPASCVVLGTEVTTRTRPNGVVLYAPRVRLGLSVGGASYSSRIALAEANSRDAADAVLASSYGAGQSVACVFDPAAPGNIALRRDAGEGRSMMGMALFFDAVFGGFFAFTLRRYVRWRRGLST